MQSVVLAQRPSISLPLSTISPALLEELTNDLSTLASVYHKPVEAFIGRGRFGADEAAKKRAAVDDDVRNGDATTRAMAIAVVAQGQRSENLLDFDDEPVPVLPSAVASSASNGGGGGLAGLDFSSPAQGGAIKAAGGGGQPNTIDDLMGLFDQAGLGPASQSAPSLTAGQPAWATMGASPMQATMGQQTQQQKKSDMDLMGDLF